MRYLVHDEARRKNVRFEVSKVNGRNILTEIYCFSHLVHDEARRKNVRFEVGPPL